MFARPICSRSPLAVRFRVLAALALTALLSASTSRAQPLADRVPADVVLYVGWQGADALPPAYQQSHLKAVLDATDLRKVFDEFLPALQRRMAQEDEEAGQVADLVRSLAVPMWRRPTALVVGGVEWNGPRGQAVPKVALLCQAGADANALFQQVDALLKQAPPDAQQMVRAQVLGDTVAVTVGYAPGAIAANGAAAAAQSLAAAPQFKAALAKVGASPVVVAYVDVERLLAEVDTAVTREGDPQARKMWPAIRQKSGIAGLKQVIATSGLDGQDWGDHVFVRAPEPRTGVLALGDPAPVTDDALRVVPQTATLAGATRFNVTRLVNGIRDLAVAFDPNAGQQFDDAMRQVSGMLEMDVQRDVLGTLGDEWVYYTDPSVGGRGLLGVVGVNRLKDADKAAAAFAKIEQMANAIAAQQMKNEEVKVQMHTTTAKTAAGDVTIHYLGTPMLSPAWAVHGGNLYVALFPQVIAGAADHVAAKGKTILDNPDFVALRKRLGGQNGGSISFMDLPRTAPDAYAQWTMISRLSGFADLFGVKSPTMIVPPLRALMPHLSPAGSVSWTDKDGWHVRSVSPFPGSTVLASDPMSSMMVTQPLAISIMLPALNRAREQANRVKSASNLRQIAMGAVLYANENKGRMPADLGGTIVPGELTASVFVSPRSSTPIPGPVPVEQLPAWVKQNSDYVWFGAGLTDAQGPDFVLAYEKPQGLLDGINVVFADAHVEFLVMHEAKARLEAQAGLRKKAGLPPPPPVTGFDGVDLGVERIEVGPIPDQPEPAAGAVAPPVAPTPPPPPPRSR